MKRKDFTPLNGRIMLESIDKEQNIWRILSMAPNVNLAHYPHLAIGDYVIPWGYHYHGSHADAVNFIQPGDIAAILKP